MGRLVQEIVVEMGEPQNIKWLLLAMLMRPPVKYHFGKLAIPWLGIGCPTRWDGSRELDWGVTNVQSVPSPIKEMQHFADHILLSRTISIWDQDLALQYLAFGPGWKSHLLSIAMFGLLASLTALLMSHRRATWSYKIWRLKLTLTLNGCNSQNEETRKYCLSTALETDRYQRN